MSDKMNAYENALKKKKPLIIREEGTIKELGIDVSGSGVISDEAIRISGSARLPGGIKTKILHVSGSASIDGDIVAEEAKISGSASADGVLRADLLKISGSFKARGLEGESARVSGSCVIEGSVRLTDTLRASGSIRVMEDLVTERSINLKGAFSVDGMLKTTDLMVELHKANCYVHGGIEAVNVEVYKHATEISFLGFKITRRYRRGRLYTPFIKASGDVYLENVVCNDVSGKKIEIGDGCEIQGTIKYSDTVYIASTAKVAKKPIRIDNSG
jgi:cytoskeletal protein CcmA (bactofilin family)